jgi:hypothetical protein
MKQNYLPSILRAPLAAGFGAMAWAIAWAIALAITLAFSACAGSPAKAGANSQPNSDELDIAIRETSDYLNANLPRGPALRSSTFSPRIRPFRNMLLTNLFITR